MFSICRFFGSPLVFRTRSEHLSGCRRAFWICCELNYWRPNRWGRLRSVRSWPFVPHDHPTAVTFSNYFQKVLVIRKRLRSTAFLDCSFRPLKEKINTRINRKIKHNERKSHYGRYNGGEKYRSASRKKKRAALKKKKRRVRRKLKTRTKLKNVEKM